MYASDEAAANAMTRQKYLEQPTIVINLTRELRDKKPELQARISRRLRGVLFVDWRHDDTYQLVVRLTTPRSYDRSHQAIGRSVSDLVAEAERAVASKRDAT